MDEGDKENNGDSEIVNLDTKLPALDTDNNTEDTKECNRDKDKNNENCSIEVTKNQDLNKEDTKVSSNDSNDNIANTEIELNLDNEESEIGNNCDILEDVTENFNNETSEECIDEVHGDSMADTTEVIIRNPNNNNQNNELLDRQERIN